MSDTKLTAADIERKDFPPEYLLNRVEELAVKIFGLTNENEVLQAQLAIVTGQRDTLRGMLVAERETVEAHRAASSETITHLVGRMNEAKAKLDAVTAERDAQKAQLDALHGPGPISVLKWKDATVVKSLPPDWYLLTFDPGGGLIGVGIATYDDVRKWKLIHAGVLDYRPIAYAELSISEGFKAAFNPPQIR